MALLHRATLHPSKLELLAAWLPTRPWYPDAAAADAAAAGLRPVGSYRFDDPAGQVGIETMLVHGGAGSPLQVPLTYRGAPLDGGDQWLIGTTEHSVLGRRWVYDACGDPAYACVLVTTIRTGASQAEEVFEVDGTLVRREPTVVVIGSGAPGLRALDISTVIQVDDHDPTLIRTDSAVLAVVRVLDHAAGQPGRPPDQPTLTGTWDGQTEPLILAYLRTA